MLSKKNEQKQNTVAIRPILIETVFIILGVLAALIANEWRQTKENNAQAAKALQHIKDEIQHNQAQVDSLIRYHSEIRDALGILRQEIIQKNHQVTYFEIMKAMPRGFSVPLLETTGWELANNTGIINHFEYDLSIALSHTYRIQAFYEDKLSKISENIYIAGNINLNDLSPVVVAYSFLAGDLVIQEQNLSNRYKQMLKDLQNY